MISSPVVAMGGEEMVGAFGTRKLQVFHSLRLGRC